MQIGPPLATMPAPADILIVDDTLENLRVLSEMLRINGFKVRPAPSGKLALQACAIRPPDLILLDINMPEMTGYEVCERLKATPSLAEIPVIFISALNDTTDKIRAFKSGGVDYITKPFRIEEVEARVATHVALRRQSRELQTNYDRIRQLEETRQNLTRLIVHDLRNPLATIRGFVEAALEETGTLSEQTRKYLTRAQDSADHLLDMTNSLLDLSRMEEDAMPLRLVPTNLVELCREVAENLALQAGSRRILVTAAGDPPPVPADRDLIRRVIQNIVGNALKFTPSQTGEITMHVAPCEPFVEVSIRDNGSGIPEQYRERVFDRFFQISENQTPGVHATGLGLFFCKLSVEKHGGRIRVDAAPGGGSVFTFVLPKNPPSGTNPPTENPIVR